jgi:ribosomal protein S12 methylthiotransferase
LAQDGYAPAPDGQPVDLVVVNTCGFIEASRRESLAVIREQVARKQAGEVKGVIVAGCLAERKKEQLFEEVPEIDQVVGVFAREEIVRAAERVLGQLKEQRTIFRPAPVQALIDRARLRITPRHLAYLKVSEGCDRLCTFCAIPGMRGKHVTKPIEEVVREAKELARDGVRELNLVAQDMTYYGVDLYGEPRLAELLRRLEDVEGIDWIRLLYNYPMYFTDDLLDVLGSSVKILPYLDIPLQHINDRVLRAMNRRHTKGQTTDLLQRLRSAVPGLVLRTTFIVGFPGETEDEFEELLEFVRAMRFERLGAFTYSTEPDTPAERLKGHLPEEVKVRRQSAIMEAQQEIAFAFNQGLVGRELPVLIDAPCSERAGWWSGRTYADAPDVDGVTLVDPAGHALRSGDLVDCEITAGRGYDLEARVGRRPPRPRRIRPKARKDALTILS